MATGRSNLSNNIQGLDKLWIDNVNGAELHDYQDWGKVKDYVDEEIVFSSTSTQVTYDNTVSFEVDKRADLLGKVELQIKRSALTGGADATNSFNDWEGYSSIERVDFWYGNRIFHTTTGQILHLDMMKKWTREDREAEAAAQGGLCNLPQRVARAAVPAVWVANLQVPWEALKKRIPIFCFPNKLRVEVKLFHINKAAHGTTLTAPTILASDCKLRCSMTHLRQPQREEIFAKVNQSNGIAVHFLSKETQRNLKVISAQTGEQSFDLKNIKNAVVDLHAILRLKNNIDGSDSTISDMWNFQLPSRLYIADNSQPVTPKIEVTYDASLAPSGAYGLFVRQHSMFPHQPLGLRIPSIPFCDESLIVRSDNFSLGHRDFLSYSNPQIIVDFDTGYTLASEGVLDVIAETHNTLVYQNGDIRSFLQSA